jgi:hypothetical protein
MSRKASSNRKLTEFSLNTGTVYTKIEKMRQLGAKMLTNQSVLFRSSVGDPDPHVLRPPRSGSISQRYGTGFGSESFPFLLKMLSGTK